MMTIKTRVYQNGDTTGKLCYEPHGRRTYGWGHRGFQFGYTLFVYKEGIDKQSITFTMSLPLRVYIAYVKAVVKIVSETPMPLNSYQAKNYHYWLDGKTWKPPYSKR